MVDSARVKLDRAAKRIDELNTMLLKEHPFSYVVETNHQTGQRSAFAKCDETRVAECAQSCGEIVQAIRSSLDHAYWDIVSPSATTPREEKAIQFPFSETAARLDEAVKNRLAPRVSKQFFDVMIALKPHGEEGGNTLLYLIDKLNVPDKHRELTPIGDYKTIDAAYMRRLFPDFPFFMGNFSAGMNYRDAVWGFAPPLGLVGSKEEREIDVPLTIVLPISELGGSAPMIPTLYELLRTADETIEIMRAAV